METINDLAKNTEQTGMGQQIMCPASMHNELGCQERREQITRLIKNVGLWNINKSILAKKFDVNRKTIYEDIKVIMKQLPKEDLLEIKVELSCALKKSLNECRKILAGPNKDDKIKLEAIDRIVKIGEALTKHLEAFGDKENVVERHEVKVEHLNPLVDDLIKMEKAYEKEHENDADSEQGS